MLIDNLCLKWNKIFVYPLHQALKDINEDNILHHIYLLYILQLANKKQCNVEYFRRGHGPASEKLGGGQTLQPLAVSLRDLTPHWLFLTASLNYI